MKKLLKKFIRITPRTTYNFLVTSGILNLFVRSNIEDLKKQKRHNKAIICGTGPSLSNLSKDIFQNVDTFAVNSYIKLHADENWPKPRFMVFQDLEVTRNLKDYIKNYDGNLIFSSYLILKINELKLKNPFIFHHHFLDHSHRESHSSYSYKTTKDVKKFIYDGYTVIYSAIELALFLDYEEIYLIGVDANYSKSLEDRNIISHGKVDPTYQDAGERICFSIKSMVKEKEIKLFNSSKSSKLKFLNFKDEIDGKKIID